MDDPTNERGVTMDQSSAILHNPRGDPEDGGMAEIVYFYSAHQLERSFASKGFRGCSFVNAVAELGEPTHAAIEVAIEFKEQRRRWFRDLLLKLPVTDPEGLATQLALLWDGAIATALVRGDPTMANAAKDAARVLLAANVASADAVSDRQLLFLETE
jgi:hypothetical protein